jgi:hypothetical protein
MENSTPHSFITVLRCPALDFTPLVGVPALLVAFFEVKGDGLRNGCVGRIARSVRDHFFQAYAAACKLPNCLHPNWRNSVVSPLRDGTERYLECVSYSGKPANLFIEPCIEFHGFILGLTKHLCQVKTKRICLELAL